MTIQFWLKHGTLENLPLEICMSGPKFSLYVLIRKDISPQADSGFQCLAGSGAHSCSPKGGVVVGWGRGGSASLMGSKPWVSHWWFWISEGCNLPFLTSIRKVTSQPGSPVHKCHFCQSPVSSSPASSSMRLTLPPQAATAPSIGKGHAWLVHSHIQRRSHPLISQVFHDQ